MTLGDVETQNAPEQAAEVEHALAGAATTAGVTLSSAPVSKETVFDIHDLSVAYGSAAA